MKWYNDGFKWSCVSIFMLLLTIVFYYGALWLKNSLMLYGSLILGVSGIVLLIISLASMDWEQNPV